MNSFSVDGSYALPAGQELGASRSSSWVVLWSLLLGGANVSLGGRTPVVLYFDGVILLWLAYEVYWRGFWPDFSGWIMRLGLFCLMVEILSAIVNYRDIFKSLAAIKVLACGLLVYAIARRAPVSMQALSLWGGVVGALLLYSYQRLQQAQFENLVLMKDEVGTTLGRSNYVASILLLLIPLAVACVAGGGGKVRLLFAACAALMFAGLIATMSRGAMLAAVVAPVLSLPLLLRVGMRVKHVLLVLAAGVLVTALLPSGLLAGNAVLIATRFENTDLGRVELMRESWRAFRENPVLGVGPGQIGGAIARRVMVPDYNWEHVNAHNIVLDALAENGLPAGLALLAMVGIVLYKSARNAVTRPNAANVALWIAFFGVVLHNMVEGSFEGQQFQVVFWTVAALVDRSAAAAPSASF